MMADAELAYDPNSLTPDHLVNGLDYKELVNSGRKPVISRTDQRLINIVDGSSLTLKMDLDVTNLALGPLPIRGISVLDSEALLNAATPVWVYCNQSQRIMLDVPHVVGLSKSCFFDDDVVSLVAVLGPRGRLRSKLVEFQRALRASISASRRGAWFSPFITDPTDPLGPVVIADDDDDELILVPPSIVLGTDVSFAFTKSPAIPECIAVNWADVASHNMATCLNATIAVLLASVLAGLSVARAMG